MTATYIVVFIVVLCIAVYAAYKTGFNEGHKQGVLDFYNADGEERANLVRDSIQ